MEYLDEMFDQFSQAFLGEMEGEGDVPYRDKINTISLNYSLDSLKEVDNYLKILHRQSEGISDTEYQNLIVWCGAYIGEVIRRNAAIEYHWIHYDDYMKNKSDSLRNTIPLSLTTHAFLLAIEFNYVTMPMNKVARWLDEGEANNVHFYASVDIAKKK